MAAAINAGADASHLKARTKSRSFARDAFGATATPSHIAAQLEYRIDLERSCQNLEVCTRGILSFPETAATTAAFASHGGRSKPVAPTTNDAPIYKQYFSVTDQGPLSSARS